MKDQKIDLKKLVSNSKYLKGDCKNSVDAKNGDEKKLEFTRSFAASGKGIPSPVK